MSSVRWPLTLTTPHKVKASGILNLSRTLDEVDDLLIVIFAMVMARPNIRLARLRARRKQAVWSPALTSAVAATHTASFSKSNKIAAYLASKITSTLTVRPIVYFFI